MRKYLFRKQCLIWDHNNSRMNWYTRAFYWCKTWICLSLSRERKNDSFLDSLAMLAFDFRRGNWEYGGTDWTEVAIGEGVFRNWWYIVYDNGTH